MRSRHLLAASATAVAVALAAVAPASASGTWPTYHGDPGRSGVDSAEAPLTPTSRAWSATLDGSAVYGQPVVADGRVIVATEADDVYALDAHDGHVLWRVNVGAPLRGVAAQAGCGDIDPLGITSTPVVDTATGTAYVVAEVSQGGAAPVHHQLVGIDVVTGTVTLSTSAEPPLPAGESPVNLQQRAALALGSGRVYVGYGGLAGDCGAYHGWLVGVDETGSRPNVSFEVAPDGQGGAIWEPGGPAVDGSGDVYVTTGNPNPGSPARTYTESAVKLSPDLQVLAHYQSPAGGDADLASDSPTLLPGGDVFVVGKADVAYVLRQPDLAPVETITGVCGSDPDGGNAYDAAANDMYVPCTGGGVQQIHLSGSGSLGWRSGADGPPILVDGLLWNVGWDVANPTLQTLQPGPATPAPVTEAAVGAPLPHFASPSAADGLILVGTSNGVVAFDGPTGPPAPAPAAPVPSGCTQAPPAAGYLAAAADGGVFAFATPFCGSAASLPLVAPVVGVASDPAGGYWLVAADGGVFSFGAAGFHGSTGGTHLNAPIVGMAPTPSGQGYWLVAADGGVFAYGDATFHGSTGGTHLDAPVVGMSADRTGGYWLAAADGGVFAFGAPFAGSAGGTRLVAPVVGIGAGPAAGTYRLVASDGGVFSYGAPFEGSIGGTRLARPVVGLASP